MTDIDQAIAKQLPKGQENWLEMYRISNTVDADVPSLRPDRMTFIHYTSLTAFYSIMRTGTLRFTSAGNTNDPTEIAFGKQVVAEALAELIREETGVRREAVESSIYRFEGEALNPFVFCTSQPLLGQEDHGELSQWRLYGANGRGVALVINAEHRNRLWTLKNYLQTPRKMIYGREKGIQIVKEEVRSFLDEISEHGFDQKQSDRGMLGEFAANRFLWLPSIMKHEAYSHEREVRFVYSNSLDGQAEPKQPADFAESGGILKPIIDRPFASPHDAGAKNRGASLLSKIIVGPSGDQAAIEDSIQHYLAAHGWSVPISRSNLPYRAP